MLSAFIVRQRVIGADIRNPVWSVNNEHYQNVEAGLENLGIEEGEIVLVNNPPAYALASGRSAIVIPDGNIEATLAAAKQFGASILILEEEHPKGLSHLYDEQDESKFVEWLQTIDGTQIFRILLASDEMK